MSSDIEDNFDGLVDLDLSSNITGVVDINFIFSMQIELCRPIMVYIVLYKKK